MEDHENIAEKSVFVKLEEYKEIISLVHKIHNKLEDVKKDIAKVKDLKVQEDSEVDLWNNSLGEIDRKLLFINNILYEPGQK